MRFIALLPILGRGRKPLDGGIGGLHVGQPELGFGTLQLGCVRMLAGAERMKLPAAKQAVQLFGHVALSGQLGGGVRSPSPDIPQNSWRSGAVVEASARTEESTQSGPIATDSIVRPPPPEPSGICSPT